MSTTPNPPSHWWVDASARPGRRRIDVVGWLLVTPSFGCADLRYSFAVGQVYVDGDTLHGRVRGGNVRFDLDPMPATPENLRAVMEDIERIAKGEKPSEALGGRLEPA